MPKSTLANSYYGVTIRPYSSFKNAVYMTLIVILNSAQQKTSLIMKTKTKHIRKDTHVSFTNLSQF